MTTSELFPDCVIPGCAQPVSAWGEVCAGCVSAFGDMLRHNPGGRRLTEQEIRRRDSETRTAYALQKLVRT